MRKTQTVFVLVLVFAVLIGVGVFSLRKSPTSTNETEEINSLVVSAGIDKITNWIIYPNCGGAGSGNTGYLLQVNNLSVSQEQASRLKSLASDKGYRIQDRGDGYEIDNNAWSIIVLNRNRADLFVSIHYPQKPKGFAEGAQFCN